MSENIPLHEGGNITKSVGGLKIQTVLPNIFFHGILNIANCNQSTVYEVGKKL